MGSLTFIYLVFADNTALILAVARVAAASVLSLAESTSLVDLCITRPKTKLQKLVLAPNCQISLCMQMPLIHLTALFT